MKSIITIACLLLLVATATYSQNFSQLPPQESKCIDAKVYPNPTYDGCISFTLSGKEYDGPVLVKIVQANGIEVYSKWLENMDADYEISSQVKKIKPGLYFITFMCPLSTTNIKLIAY